MKKLLLIACVSSFGLVNAQSFTAANEYDVNDSIMMFQIDSVAPNFANTIGSSVTWDYSSYPKYENEDKLYKVAANTDTTFTGSNKKISIGPDISLYIETGATGRKLVGLKYATGNAILGEVTFNLAQNSINLMNYPFGINEPILDDLAGTITTNLATTNATGTSLSLIDAIGTIQLNDSVSYAGTLRHHMLDSINTTFFGNSFEFVIDQYEYYNHANTNLPVFSYLNIVATQNGTNTLSDVNLILSTSDQNATAALQDFIQEQFVVYPNPASSTLNINGVKEVKSMQITTLDGKELYNGTIQELNINALPKGTYLIKVGNTVKQFQKI